MQKKHAGSGKITAISMVVIIGLSIIGVITALSGIGVEKAATVKSMEAIGNFDSTTELYPVPASDVYSDLAELAGVAALVDRAKQYQQQQQPIKALHLLEVALAADPADQSALETRLSLLQSLLEQAARGTGNNYEKDYLRHRISVTEQALTQ